ncbi:MAG: ferredoxin family protein [Anaerolineaceae bacterium]
MAHVITNLCLRDAGCVVVCPVACIVPGNPPSEWPLFYIDPATCIDCGACIPECPYGAIFNQHDVPQHYVASGGEVLSAPVGTPGYAKPHDAFTYEGEPVRILATRVLSKGEVVDLTDSIQINRDYFLSGPRYDAQGR